MKKKIILLAMLCTSLLLLAGCGEDKEKKTAVKKNNIEVAIKKINPSFYEFQLTNTTGKDITYDMPTPCSYSYTVKNKNDDTVGGSPEMMCAQVLTPITFKKEETKTYPIDLTPLNLEKGKYEIKATLKLVQKENITAKTIHEEK